jgi:ketosteroid isomerase-like protein
LNQCEQNVEDFWSERYWFPAALEPAFAHIQMERPEFVKDSFSVFSEIFPNFQRTSSLRREYFSSNEGGSDMPGQTEEEILTQEENLTQAQRQLDISALDRLFADDVMFTGVMGQTCGKAGLVSEWKEGIAQRDKAIAEGKKIVGSFDKEDMKVVSHGDTAVTSYRFMIRFQGDGLDVNRRYRRTLVWLKREGQWQVIAGHMSSLDPQGAR